MRYDEFRDLLKSALREAGLSTAHASFESETVELANSNRHWQSYVQHATLQEPEPFHVSAKVAFHWSPVDAARAYTCEEDLLADMLGRRQRYPKTQPRWMRVNLVLRGTLSYGSTTPMPDPEIFGSWVGPVGERLDRRFVEHREREGRIVAVTGARDEITVEARSIPDGTMFLKGLSVSGFRLVRLPRVWDDPARPAKEKDSDDELAQLAALFKGAIDEWTWGLADLARWIQYSPPAPGSKPAEPWFDDEIEDAETIH